MFPLKIVSLTTLVACSSATPIGDAGADAAADSHVDVFEAGTVLCVTSPPFGPGGGACTFTYHDCSDGQLYQVNCEGAGLPCTCLITNDAGQTPGAKTMQNLCMVPTRDQVRTINMVCGWSIQSK